MNIERQSEIEVAVYWYLNGEKINVDWYQEKFIFENSVFQTIRDKDVVRATVFLKKKGCPDASRVFNVGAEFV